MSKRNYGEKYGSASDSWRSKFWSDYEDGWWSWSSKGSSYTSGFYGQMNEDQLEAVKLKSVLKSVIRSANIIPNANLTIGKSQDKELRVDWIPPNDPSPYNLEDKTIYLNPDVASQKSNINKKAWWTPTQHLDVLIGTAIMESGMKRDISKKAYDKIIGLKSHKSGKLYDKLWFASECLSSMNAVTDDYPGFKQYFNSYVDYYTDDNDKAAIEYEALNSKPSANIALNLALWNMLHQDDQITIPEPYTEAVKAAIDKITSNKSSDGRADDSINIINDFTSRWPVTEKDKQPSARTSGLARGQVSGKEQTKTDAHADTKGQENRYTDKTTDYSFSAKDEMCDLLRIMQHNVKSNSTIRAKYKELVSVLRPQIQALKNRLKLRNEEPNLAHHGMKIGDLDEGSLFKLGFYKSGYNDPKIFEEKEIIDKPKIAVSILIDESGSMGPSDAPGKSSYMARRLAIVLAEALRDIDGIALSVLGHTGQGRGHDSIECIDGMILHKYYTPEHDNMEAMSRITGLCENLDGYAIYHTVKHMLNWYHDYENKLLIHITDGIPSACGYGNAPAWEHVNRVCKSALRKGVEVICFGVGSHYSQEVGSFMYGSTRSINVKNIAKCPTIVSNLITKLIYKTVQL